MSSAGNKTFLHTFTADHKTERRPLGNIGNTQLPKDENSQVRKAFKATKEKKFDFNFDKSSALDMELKKLKALCDKNNEIIKKQNSKISKQKELIETQKNIIDDYEIQVAELNVCVDIYKESVRPSQKESYEEMEAMFEEAVKENEELIEKLKVAEEYAHRTEADFAHYKLVHEVTCIQNNDENLVEDDITLVTEEERDVNDEVAEDDRLQNDLFTTTEE